MSRRTRKVIVFSGITAAILILAFGRTGISKQVGKTVNAVVRINGSEMAIPSSITISGNIKRTLSERSFTGTFAMEYCRQSCGDGVEAKISWGDGVQSIWFIDHGNLTALGVRTIEIDEQMEQIRVVFDDGTVMETVN